MSVDQAFDNLMHRNALAIPVAGGGRDGDGARESRPATDSVMRVSTLLGGVDDTDDGDADASDSGRDPGTGVDLSALPEDVANAYLHGARIVSRDTEELYSVDTDKPAAGSRPNAEGKTSRFATRLEGARRVRRFSYLPLSGMDVFESDARDMAAGLAALDPERPSLAVSSAERGEGRTELAIRLALALAKRVDHKVLLADFDIKNPQAAARLGASSKRFTLADVLRGACPLADALTVSEEDNLYLLPSRALDRDGDEILDGRQVEGLFAELHRTFAFTIIDCGPVSRADAMILARLAGFTVLAGFCGVSSAGSMKRAGARLTAGGARVAGVLLAGT